MKIHEYQAKELFRRYDVPVPSGSPAGDVETAWAIAAQFCSFPVAVKAQIHAGGRGKGGGVKMAASLAEVRAAASAILGMQLVTPQTGPGGKRVNKILVEKGVAIGREFYLGILPDRSTAQVMMMVSTEGGMDIEEVAADSPAKIIRIGINPLTGIEAFHCRQVVFALGLSGAAAKSCVAILRQLYRMFMECDCSLVEINPLVLTTAGELVALDAKVELDPNGLFRHPEIAAWRDPAEEEPLEAEAAVHKLNYIKLGGNIGNMVNGAGLAMATMDLIMKAGGEPANFLDVGGGASADMVENGFRILLSDENVKGVLINIFGGILRCDVLAEGVVQAARKTGIAIPVVVRMEGTNVDEGRRILAESGLNLITAVDLADAAAKVAEIVGK